MAFVLTKPVTPSGSSVDGLAITNINGQPILTLVDPTRADKILSVAENPVQWSNNKLRNNEWLRVGNANDTDSAYIADFDGTVTAASGQCENVNNNNKNIHLYINEVDKGSIGSLNGTELSTFINTTLDINYNQGDHIRLRAVDGVSGQIEDTVVKIILKWRGA